MKDERIVTLAKNLINYSTKLKKDEKVLIETIDFELPLTKQLVKEAYLVGAKPYVTIKNPQIQRELIKGSDEGHMKNIAKYEVDRMKDMDAYIGIRCHTNSNEFAGISSDKEKLYTKLYVKPVHLDVRVLNTKWVILRYPNPSMAQAANMATEDFEDLYFDVCNLDYSKMSKAMDSLVELMEKTKIVTIKSPRTSLSFSIEGLPAIKCAGELNIPDGEVFTAPIKNSVNGYIEYNTPSIYHGTTFENIRFEIENGKIIKATSNNTKKLNEILDTDEGSRYFGEFAIGVNPYIKYPMKDTLFDEKIDGSFHFTPGSCYDECDNSNKSSNHWDLVSIQRSDYGGGEIYFDDQLIRKDGVFVIDSLKCLNPENLK